MTLRSVCIGPADSGWHEAFFDYLPRVFPGLDFRLWHARGGWTDSYRAHALVAGERIVANVAVSSMEVLMDGAPVRGAQLGAVGVVPEWRSRGLQRRLMGAILPRLEADHPLVFLFANDQVLEFYPRFGFERTRQHIFGIEQKLSPTREAWERLRLEHPPDLELFRALCARSLPVSHRLGTRRSGAILLWHATYEYADHLYYAREHDAVLIAEQLGELVMVHDVIASRSFDLVSSLRRIIGTPVRRIEFGFTPELWCPDAGVLREDMASPLFVRGRARLPSLPFKFPALAHT